MHVMECMVEDVCSALMAPFLIEYDDAYYEVPLS